MTGVHVPLSCAATPGEDVEAVLECLRSGWLTMGPRTKAFEEALCAYLGGGHVVATSSGVAALHLALFATGVGPGDEVLVPALAPAATADAVRNAGAQPVLCDTGGPDDLNVDTRAAAERVTPRTRAAIAVHLCGYPADLAALGQLCDAQGLILIEDCAQALGAVVDDAERLAGTVGDTAIFDFSSKQQLYMGEGGAVATTDVELDKRLRMLRSHAMTSGTWDRHRGHAPAYDVVEIGFNSRMDELHAALGLSRLSRFDREVEARRAIARVYRERLADLPLLRIPWSEGWDLRSSHFAFPVLLADSTARDRFRAGLGKRGVETAQLPTPEDLEGLSRAAETAARSCMLPLSSAMTEDEVDLVVDAVRSMQANLG